MDQRHAGRMHGGMFGVCQWPRRLRPVAVRARLG
jgi:hypothetical protein